MVLKLNLIIFFLNYPSIKFEYEIYKTEINFLNITVFEVDSKLRTKVYVKPTDRQSYLRNKSEHPNSTKKSIACSEVLRFNKICCNRSDLHNNCERLLNTLTKRVHNQNILQQKSTVLFQFQETSY